METTAVKLYSTGYREAKTYLAAALFVAGNIVLPQICHLVPQGGLRWLPIYFFTLVGAYKYGWRVGLLTAVAMFRASGAMEWLTGLCAPVLEFLGIPPETTPLMLVRPVSGSGALAVGTELITTYGPDSYIGRVAAVMLGSTETTFYVIAVYFGAAGIKKTRYAVPAALCADLTGFVVSALTVRLFWP